MDLLLLKVVDVSLARLQSFSIFGRFGRLGESGRGVVVFRVTNCVHVHSTALPLFLKNSCHVRNSRAELLLVLNLAMSSSMQISEGQCASELVFLKLLQIVSHT